MMKALRILLENPWVDLLARLILGGVFLWAAMPKLIDPPGFAKNLYEYALYPAWSIHPMALFVPWLEFLCGSCLILGVWVRAMVAQLTVLLVAFILSLSINLYREHPVDCGCFGSSTVQKTTSELMADMRLDVYRDIALLGLCALLFFSVKRSGTCCPWWREKFRDS